MTHNEFGLRLRKLFPKLVDVPLNNEELARYFLNLYPQYYDTISPSARALKEVSETEFTSSAWFESTRLQNESTFIDNQAKRINTLAQVPAQIEASARGLTLHAYEQMRIEEHKTEMQIRLDNHALDSANRDLLTPHELMQCLENDLMALIDRRDKEPHPDKRKVLDARIKHLMEELDARGRQALVQVTGGLRLEHQGESPDFQGGHREEAPSELEPLPPETNRIGF